jgi:hypothetical protein
MSFGNIYTYFCHKSACLTFSLSHSVLINDAHLFFYFVLRRNKLLNIQYVFPNFSCCVKILSTLQTETVIITFITNFLRQNFTGTIESIFLCQREIIPFFHKRCKLFFQTYCYLNKANYTFLIP